MEKLDKSKARAIGVSNFNINKLEKLAKTQKIVPAANQVELHPFLPQDDLVKYCKDHGILGKYLSFPCSTQHNINSFLQ